MNVSRHHFTIEQQANHHLLRDNNSAWLGELGDIMLLSISLDHRVVDGADGARFMNEVTRLLEDPNLLLLEG